jgi:hypothetical protein
LPQQRLPQRQRRCGDRGYVRSLQPSRCKRFDGSGLALVASLVHLLPVKPYGVFQSKIVSDGEETLETSMLPRFSTANERSCVGAGQQSL